MKYTLLDISRQNGKDKGWKFRVGQSMAWLIIMVLLICFAAWGVLNLPPSFWDFLHAGRNPLMCFYGSGNILSRVAETLMTKLPHFRNYH
jgi:hypothetical protein